jgi:lysophospholipase L1-like esterase
MAVVDAGISGNRVLSNASYSSGINALARFDRDVIDQPGAKYVIVLEGINDIGAARDNPSPSADEIIAGHRQLIARAHAAGIEIIGATLTPFEGANYYSESGEAKRQAVNKWIRESHEYDGVVDFDAAVRDPDHPGRFCPEYDSGDRLHPGDAGYRAMAECIDLTLFRP